MNVRGRYYNLEVSDLGQRVEGSRGRMILTTKVQADMDEAFLRRLHTSIHVPKPEEDMRPAVWCSLPDLMCGPLFMIV